MITVFKDNTFFKHGAIYAIGTVLTGFFNYLFQFVTSRHLSVAAYGELQSLVALFTILAVWTVAINYFAIKYGAVLASHNDREATHSFRSWLYTKVGRSLIFLILGYGVIGFVLYSYLHLTDAFSLAIVYAGVGFAILASVDIGILNAWQLFFAVNVVYTLAAASKFISGLFLALHFPSASIVAFALLVGGLVSWVAAHLYTQTKLKRSLVSQETPHWQETYFKDHDLWYSGVRVLVFSLLVVLLGNLDQLLVKNIASSEVVGQYSVLKVLGGVILVVNTAFIASLLPYASGLGHKGVLISGSLLRRAYGLILGCSIGAIVIYYFLGTVLITQFFGVQYSAFAGDLWLFGIMMTLVSLLLFESHIAFARHNFKVLYILGLVVFLEIIAIYAWNDTLRQIVLASSSAFFVGYIGIAGMNVLHRRLVHTSN